jgi:hypothetical protein
MKPDMFKQFPEESKCKKKFYFILFHFSISSRPALGPPYLLSIGCRGLFPGNKESGHEVDHSPQINAEVKNPFPHTPSWLSV